MPTRARVSSFESLWRSASETLEQQQDWNPRHAKSTPKKCLTLPLESIKEVQSSLSRNASVTLEQQQNSNPRHAESTPKKCLTLPLKAIKEDTKPLDDAPSKTAEQQQDSSPRHAKTTPKKCLTLPLESIKENTKPLVLARPRPRKKHTGQNGRAPSKSQKNGVRSKHCQDAFSRCWHGHGQGKNTRVKTAEPHLNRRKIASEASAARMLFVAKPLDAPLPKQPNSSRIRAHES